MKRLYAFSVLMLGWATYAEAQTTASASVHVAIPGILSLRVEPAVEGAAGSAASAELPSAVVLRVSANRSWRLVARAEDAARAGAYWRVSTPAGGALGGVQSSYTAIGAVPVELARGRGGRDITVVLDSRGPGAGRGLVYELLPL